MILTSVVFIVKIQITQVRSDVMSNNNIWVPWLIQKSLGASSIHLRSRRRLIFLIKAIPTFECIMTYFEIDLTKSWSWRGRGVGWRRGWIVTSMTIAVMNISMRTTRRLVSLEMIMTGCISLSSEMSWGNVDISKGKNLFQVKLMGKTHRVAWLIIPS